MPLILPKNLARLSTIAARDATRFTMTGLRVFGGENGYRVEATDGRRLAIGRGPCAEADAIDGVLIPAPDWTAGMRLGKKAAEVALSVTENDFTFAAGGQSSTGQLLDGRFPDVDGVLPTDRPLWSVNVDAELLAGLLQAAAACCDDDTARVAIHYYGKGKTLGVACHNANGQFFDGLLVPLSEPRPKTTT